MQPLEWDLAGIIRFKENKIVIAFLNAATNAGCLNLNDVARMNFSQEEQCSSLRANCAGGATNVRGSGLLTWTAQTLSITDKRLKTGR
jgi:hypothetical protein